MAEFSQKLKIRLKSGTIQAIRLYSTAADIPAWQKPMRMRVGGVVAWVPTSPVGSPDASSLRVRHPGSNAIYVVNTIGRATYGSQIFYNPGNFTFTVPAGARKLRITLVGGGSTGATASAGGSRVGEATSFAGYTASGAAAATKGSTIYLANKIPPQDGYFSQYGSPAQESINQYAVWRSDGQDNGESLVSRYDKFAPGSGFGAASAGLGSDGRVQFYGGLRGGYNQQTIHSTPQTVLSGYIGKGGAGFKNNYIGTNGAYDFSQLGNAAQGCVFVEWGGTIE